MRRIYHPRISDSEGTLPVIHGGLGSRDIDKAAQNIGLVTYRLANKPFGIILYNAQKRISKDSLPPEISDPSVPSLYGNREVEVGQTLILKITNYDSFTIYSVFATNGVAIQRGEEIHYTAGVVSGPGSITINGRTFLVTIKSPRPLTPSVVVPSEDSQLSNTTATFEATAFNITGNYDTHASTDWEVSTDPQFNTLIAAIYETPVHKLTWTVNNMQELKKHYVRVRYRGQQRGVSDWSPVREFTTGNDGLINTETGVIMPNIPGQYQAFGHSITLSADGNIALIGSPNYGEKGTDAGAVYYFKKIDNVWTQIGKIFSPFPAVAENFGFNVSTNNQADILLVGCWKNSPSKLGKVYVFVRSGDVWTYQQEIRHPLRNINNDISYEFGIAVAISGDGLHVVIGNHIDNYIPGGTVTGGTVTGGEGGAYYFTRSGNTWTHVASLYSNEVNEPQFFGFGLSLNNDGTFLAIGSFGDTVNGVRTGSVYIYTRSGSTWTFRQKITPPVPSNNLQFGYAIALAKDASILYIGAPYQKGKVFKYSQSNLVFNYDNELILYNDNVWNNGIGLALSSDKRFLMIGVGGGISTSGAVRIIE